MLTENAEKPMIDAVARRGYTAKEILETDWGEIKFYVSNLLPAGLTILGGLPKVGKSILSLQAAVAISKGEMFLGETTTKATVLYLAYEDSYRRLKERLAKQGVKSSEDLNIVFHDLESSQEVIGNLSTKGVKLLGEVIKGTESGVVFIDTFARSLNTKSKDFNDYATITEILKPLHNLANVTQTAIILVDHFNKKNWNSNIVTRVGGSIAKTGMADTAWGLFEEKGKYHLEAVGRDIEGKTLTLIRDGELDQWVIDESAEDFSRELSTNKTLIIAYLKEKGKATNKEIADALGKDKSNVFTYCLKPMLGNELDRDETSPPYQYFIRTERKE
jgi:hypothetical protein